MPEAVDRRTALSRFAAVGAGVALNNSLAELIQVPNNVRNGSLVVGGRDPEEFGVLRRQPQCAATPGLLLVPNIFPDINGSKQLKLVDQDKRSILEEMKARWLGVFADPLWYKTVVPDRREWEKLVPKTPKTQELYEDLDDFWVDQLMKDKIRFATPEEAAGLNFDRLREGRKVDLGIGHHSAEKQDASAWHFSAWGLQFIYAPDYFDNQKTGDPEKDKDRDFLGEDITDRPIWSGHFMDMPMIINGQQVLKRTLVFSSYHWKINSDGQAERLLEDAHLGFHAPGVNARSIGIVFNGTYTDTKPDDVMFDGFVEVWRKYSDNIPPENVYGHKEIPYNHTVCPSELFLGPQSWKKELVAKLK